LIDADCVADLIEPFRTEPAMRFLGRDPAPGAPRWKDLGLRKPATVNRLKSALSALFTRAKDRRRRLLPSRWPSRRRDLPSDGEDNERVRFRSAAEREQLFKAARVSAWPKLYLLIHSGLDQDTAR
jgi:hypothetical protein